MLVYPAAKPEVFKPRKSVVDLIFGEACGGEFDAERLLVIAVFEFTVMVILEEIHQDIEKGFFHLSRIQGRTNVSDLFGPGKNFARTFLQLDFMKIPLRASQPRETIACSGDYLPFKFQRQQDGRRCARPAHPAVPPGVPASTLSKPSASSTRCAASSLEAAESVPSSCCAGNDARAGSCGASSAKNVVDVLGEARAFGDQRVTTARHGIVNRTVNREHLASPARRARARGDQRAGFARGFHHQHAETQPADDAVAAGEILRAFGGVPGGNSESSRPRSEIACARSLLRDG